MEENSIKLIRRFLSGEEDAFRVLMQKYQKRIHALASKKLGEYGDFYIAQEITQDTFLQVYKKLHTLKDHRCFDGWLYVIVSRQCLNWIKSNKKSMMLSLEDIPEEEIESTSYRNYESEQRETESIEFYEENAKRLLRKLPESERTVITLHYIGEMTATEISKFLGVSVNTIKSRLRRAKQRLESEDEQFISKTFRNIQLSTDLTDSIMERLANVESTPPVGKPLVPWFAAASTLLVVLLMLGIGNQQFFARFQQPYSLDANAETMVELVDTPIVENLILEHDRRRQISDTQARLENPVSERQPTNTPHPSTETDKENNMENYPQWNLPEKAEARLGKGGISAMQFSPDGNQLAISSSTGVWFYDVSNGKELSLLPWKGRFLTFSSDGRFLASGGGDPTSNLGGTPFEEGVVLWDRSTESDFSLQDKLPAAAVLRFSNDNKTLVFFSLSRDTIYRVNVETGETTTTLMEERPGSIHLENYALTEDRIAIGSSDGRIEMWDTTTGKKLSTLREIGKEFLFQNYIREKNYVLTMKFSPDGKRLATGNLDTTVQLWDTTSGEELVVYQKPIERNMWSITRTQGNGKDILNNPMRNETNSRPYTLEFSPDGSLLACGSDDSTVKLWDTMTGELILVFTGHLSAVNRLTFSPDGAILASVSRDGTVRFWDVKKQKNLQTHITGHQSMRIASFVNDDSALVSVSYNGIITNWDLRNSKKRTIQTKTTLAQPSFWGVFRHHVLSPDGRILASQAIQSDPTKPHFSLRVLLLTDVKTGRELDVFPHEDGSLYSPDGRFLAGWGGNKIRLLDTETGEKREIIIAEESEGDTDAHTPILKAFEFSPDGKKIVSGTYGGLVQLWEVDTGIELSSFFEEQPRIDGRYEDPITTFAFSSDGSILAVGSRKKIRLLGTSKRPYFKEVSEAEHVYDDVILFSPDDKVLLRSLIYGGIQLFDVATGDKLTSLGLHSIFLEDLKFSPDKKMLMSVADGTILFWNWDDVLLDALGEEQENVSEHIQPIKEESTENMLQFLEHSQQQQAKTSDHILWKGEVYLVNEWFEVALEEFTNYLTAAEYHKNQNVTTPPSFDRELFARIGKASKDIQDKDGFVNMMKTLMDRLSDNQSIQMNAHLVLAKFYQAHDMVENAEEHLRKIDLLTADLSTQGLNFQLNAYLSLVDNYHDSGNVDKADEYIQKIDEIAAKLNRDDSSSLKLQLGRNLGLAEFFREHGILEKADEYIKKTGFVHEDAWMVLGPYDNVGGIGYDTAYIPEDITEIDLNAIYDGLNGEVSWKKFSDDKLDGYIHLGGRTVDWRVSYTFATVTSPDEREVQFRFDSDDQGKVWLNGTEVFKHTKTFAARIDHFTIPVTLKSGKNSILVKVCNETGGWGFYLRITDQDGQPFDDLIMDSATHNVE